MKILVDTHTHTSVSAHAYSSLKENLDEARKKGLEMICMTDHAPNMIDGAHIWHFYSLEYLPNVIKNVKIMSGIEADVLNGGILDINEEDFKNIYKPEIVIASIHEPLYEKKSEVENTRTWLNIIKNPLVDICGHSGNPKFSFGIEAVVKSAREHNKCIEINNNSFVVRRGSKEVCAEIAKACKKIGTKIVVSSDAHNCWQVGNFEEAIKMLEEIEFPEELVMNTSSDKFIDYIETLHNKKLDFS